MHFGALMNANELADWVENQSSFGWAGDFGKFLIEIATTLRYQENQIQALKTQLAYLETKVYGGSTK